MPRPIQARIDLSALRHNYLIAKKQSTGLGKPAKAWAVVKADAYGHGLMRTANALADIADGFALLDLNAGVALRDAGFSQPILLLEGFFEPDDLSVCAEYGLIPAVHLLEQLHMIRAAALPVRLPIYLKLNTGMNRLGFTLDQLPAVKLELAASPAIAHVTLMTHFAEADGGRGIQWQLERFDQRIPDATTGTLPLPFGNAGAAFGTRVDRLGFCHAKSRRSARVLPRRRTSRS